MYEPYIFFKQIFFHCSFIRITIAYSFVCYFEQQINIFALAPLEETKLKIKVVISVRITFIFYMG